jgi:hypothetical protein
MRCFYCQAKLVSYDDAPCVCAACFPQMVKGYDLALQELEAMTKRAEQLEQQLLKLSDDPTVPS